MTPRAKRPRYVWLVVVVGSATTLPAGWWFTTARHARNEASWRKGATVLRARLDPVKPRKNQRPQK